jgi:hypothetical protein
MIMFAAALMQDKEKSKKYIYHGFGYAAGAGENVDQSLLVEYAMKGQIHERYPSSIGQRKPDKSPFV